MKYLPAEIPLKICRILWGKTMSVGNKIVIGFISVIAIALVCIVAANQYLMSDLSDNAFRSKLKDNYKTLTSSILAEAGRAESMSALVANIPAAQKMFAERDRDGLIAMFGPSFGELKQKYAVRQFQFHTPPAQSFARIHKPKKFGDDLSSFRKTVVNTNDSKKPTFGLEVGVAGLGVRGMVPVFHEDKHLGSIEFGMSFGQAFFEHFKKDYGVDAALYLKRGAEFERFATTFGDANPFDPASLNSAFSGEAQFSEFDKSGENLAIYAEVVNNFSGDPIGVIVVGRSTAVDVAALAHARNLSLLISGVALIAALVVAFVLGRSIGYPIKAITAAISAMANGDMDRDIPESKNCTEVNEIAKALVVFKNNMLNMRQMEENTKRNQAKNQLASDINRISNMATTLETVNSTAINLYHLNKHSTEVSSSGQSIAAAAAQLVSSVDEISRNSESAAQNAREADEMVRHATNAANETQTAIRAISQAVNTSVESLEDLSSASDQIGQILSVIEEIAGQTNLLALNATIEAARAGEAGKGFAVVAAEVKELSNQTSKTTEDIARRIELLRSGMNHISQTMDQTKSAVEGGNESILKSTETMHQAVQRVTDVTARMEEINQILSDQKSASSEIAESVNGVADLAEESRGQVMEISGLFAEINDEIAESAGDTAKSDDPRILCEIAKVDHIIFTKRTIDAVMGRIELKSNQLTDHKLCRLGRWYGALTDEAVTSMPAFEQLEEPHQQVHNYARKALTSHEANDQKAALEHLEVMSRASHEVIAKLDELSHAIEAKEKRLEVA